MKNMKNAILVFLVLFIVSGCGNSGPKTTQTSSEGFASVGQKQQFLENYVTFRKTYKKLDFNIFFQNNGGGMVPGPSDWDIRLIAVVPDDEMSGWFEGYEKISNPDIDWLKDVPTTIDYSSILYWYKFKNVLIGIDLKNNIVAYRNLSI